MSRRIAFVDFGPVALPVHGGIACWDTEMPGVTNRREDTIRLQHLLGMGKAGGADGAEPADEANNADFVFEASPADLGTQPHPDASGTRLATAIRCLKLASSVASISAGIATCVRLSLREDLLPQASLSVERNADGLCFEVCLSSFASMNELASGLDQLAYELGTQLQSPLVLRLIDGTRDCLVREVCWPSGGVA